jgi:hypothetical protein
MWKIQITSTPVLNTVGVNMWTVEEFKKVLKSWKRNDGRGVVSKVDIAIVCAWNYDKVDDELLADVLAHYLLDTGAEGVKDFIQQTLYKDER